MSNRINHLHNNVIHLPRTINKSTTTHSRSQHRTQLQHRYHNLLLSHNKVVTNKIRRVHQVRLPRHLLQRHHQVHIHRSYNSEPIRNHHTTLIHTLRVTKQTHNLNMHLLTIRPVSIHSPHPIPIIPKPSIHRSSPIRNTITHCNRHTTSTNRVRQPTRMLPTRFQSSNKHNLSRYTSHTSCHHK